MKYPSSEGLWLSDTSIINLEERLDFKKVIMNNEIKEENGKETNE